MGVVTGKIHSGPRVIIGDPEVGKSNKENRRLLVGRTLQTKKQKINKERLGGTGIPENLVLNPLLNPYVRNIAASKSREEGEGGDLPLRHVSCIKYKSKFFYYLYITFVLF